MTSLFALSACGGGFFDWYYYEKPEETALDETPTANPANTAVTQITTDLSNVNLNIAGGGTVTFTVDDDGVITGLSGDINADRYDDQRFEGSGDKYTVYTLSSGDLKYSDFGHIDGDFGGSGLFAGGDSEKIRSVYTKSEIVAISNGDSGNKISFVGTAVGVLKNDGKFCTNARTEAASLEVTGSTFQLDMPFYSNGDGKFYDVTVNGSYAYTKGEFVNGPDAHTVILSGPQMVEFMDDRPFSETGYINAYGNTTATEAVGTVHLVGETNYGSEAVFDAAFGVTKK